MMIPVLIAGIVIFFFSITLFWWKMTNNLYHQRDLASPYCNCKKCKRNRKLGRVIPGDFKDNKKEGK